MNTKMLIPFFERENKMKFLIRLEHRMQKKHKYISYVINNIIYKKYHCDISASAEIDDSIRFPHPIGIVIGDGVKIGSGCRCYQNVTIGGREHDQTLRYPTIEDDVIIYPNSIIIGDIIVRKGSIIGAGSVITKDTEENSVNYGIAASCKRIHE